MIVRILEVFLDQIVIHVLGGKLGACLIEAHGFQLEHDHRAGRILGQGLVDADADLIAGSHPPFDEVGRGSVSARR